MGRPINKKYLGDAVGSIKVTNYYRVGGEEIAGQDDTFIVRQRSTNKFLVSDTSSAWTEVLTLVDKDAGTLSAGEFRISGEDADGAVFNVTRLYNRTMRLGTATATVIKEPWTITPVQGAPTEAITGITEANPAVVTAASTANMISGETVTITGVTGMVEVTDGAYIVNVLDGTTFELVGINSTGYTTYTGPSGTVSDISVASSGGIDTQDA
jgi:hypothetical protein|tara:strand:+ start:474 stop:1109 length:636 start_codon:yes stop_codon:yes gene_type:complete